MLPLLFMVGTLISGFGLYYLLLVSVLFLPLAIVLGGLGWGLYSVLSLIDKKNHLLPRILIVEDDPDMATLVEATFKELGCPTSVATSLQQAENLLSENCADIVILDWLLQDNIKASQLLNIATQNRLISKAELRPKVVTYSSLEPEEIDFPKTECFQYMEHWQKSIPRAEFKNRSRQLIAQAEL